MFYTPRILYMFILSHQDDPLVICFLALSKGKHVFEIYWPSQMRSTHASIGVGTDDAPLFVKPKESLVGCNKKSWGLDIVRRRVTHEGKMLVSVPKNGLVPDK